MSEGSNKMLWRCGCDLDEAPAHLETCCPMCLKAEQADKATPAADGFCCCRDERRQGARHEIAEDTGTSEDPQPPLTHSSSCAGVDH